jgi:hypothetical protein
MPQKKPTNPFYVALLPVGVVFALTACAFVVMTMRGLDPQNLESTGLIQLMERRGVSILVGELGLLGVLTFAAIASDDFWQKRFDAAHSRAAQPENDP